MHNGNLVCNVIPTPPNSGINCSETTNNKDLNKSGNSELLLHYDSKLFGYLKLDDQENLPKRKLVLKTITYVEKTLAVHIQNELNKCDNLLVDEAYYKLYNTLGHLHLLLGEFSKALSAYQRFYTLNTSSYKDSTFLYGIGIVYFHYNNFKWAKKAFLELVYLDPSFKCNGEVNVYLGLIFIEINDFLSSIKHFERANSDNRPSSVSKFEIQFHIAHVYVLQNDISSAQLLYEKLLADSNLPAYIRAHVLQQLGWILQTEVGNSNDSKSTAAIQLLQKSLETDPSSGQSWYFLGRCFSSIGKVHDAFVSYRHSIDKSEASADTWCSIGVLYQQQSQPMDALQAYICAVQLRRDHPAAWTDLGVLYESCQQFDDALICYKNAASTSKRINSQSTAEKAVIDNRVKVLQQQQNATNDTKITKVKTLPSIDEAWGLPIPAELTSRQSANNRQMKIHLQHQARLASLTAAGLAGGYLPKNIEENGINIKIEPEIENNIKKEPPSVHQRQILRYLQDNKDKLDSEQKRVYDILSSQIKMVNGRVEESAPNINEVVEKTGSEYEPSPKNKKISLCLNSDEKSEVLNEMMRFDDKEVEQVLSRNVFGHEHVSDHAINSLHSMSGDTFNKVRVPPAPLSKDQLNPSTPSVYVSETDNKKEAMSKRVQQYVMSQDICVIRGMATALKLDLGLFSTKSLLETNPQHQVEIRTQRHQAPSENKDENGQNIWRCESSRAFTTITNYANYQASTFQESLKDELDTKIMPHGRSSVSISENESDSNSSSKIKKRHRIIKFGTNVDLSDSTVWKPQLLEISKLPVWCRVVSACNMLSHVGYDILGINTVQLYMKVPGSRTPGHQENLNFPAVNINIGPGDTEWFGVSEAYWPLVAKLCEKNGINYLKGSWWPNLEDLYDNDIPVYRFVQKPGDVVWVGAGVVHWVQAVGWCNNIAWNVAPMTGEVLRMGADRYEYNRLCTYKSLVPLKHLAWKMAENIRGLSPDLHTCITRILRQTLRRRRAILQLLHCEDEPTTSPTACNGSNSKNGEASKDRPLLRDDFKIHPREDSEPAHYCHTCEVEVFDILFVRELNNAHIVECLHCARQFTASRCFKGYAVLAEHPLSTLLDIYRTFVNDQCSIDTAASSSI